MTDKLRDLFDEEYDKLIAEIGEESFFQLPADALCKVVKQRTAERIVQQAIDNGALVQLPGGRVIEPELLGDVHRKLYGDKFVDDILRNTKRRGQRP
jgi:hypothetical protein